MIICLNNKCSINQDGKYCGRRTVNDEWNSRCVDRKKANCLMVSIGELINFKYSGDKHDAPKTKARTQARQRR